MVPSFRAGSSPACLLACLLLPLFVASPVAAEVIYTLGRAERVEEPSPMSSAVNVPQAFWEGEARGDPLTFTVNGVERRRYDDEVDTCAATVSETFIDSHYVFQNPDHDVRNDGFVVFSGEILGILFERSCMSDSDPYFMLPVSYGSSGLGLTPSEGDVLEILPGGRAIFHRLSVLGGATDYDGYRVLNRAPPSDLAADLRLECTGLDREVMIGDEEEITLVLTNTSTLDAPDPQILFRPPSSSSIVRFESSYFDCTERSVGIVECLARDAAPTLLPGESASLRVILRFDAVPMPVERLQAFGSGAVRDPNLGDNDCDIRAFGPGGGDAGLPDSGSFDGGPSDGGTSDGAVSDGGLAGDGSSVGSDSDTMGVSFRGTGGCGCGVAAEDPRGWVFGAGGVLLLAIRRHRWRRRRDH